MFVLCLCHADCYHLICSIKLHKHNLRYGNFHKYFKSNQNDTKKCGEFTNTYMLNETNNYVIADVVKHVDIQNTINIYNKCAEAQIMCNLNHTYTPPMILILIYTDYRHLLTPIYTKNHSHQSKNTVMEHVESWTHQSMNIGYDMDDDDLKSNVIS